MSAEKKFFQGMIDKEYKLNLHRFESHQDNHTSDGITPADMCQEAIDELHITLGPPLKKMQNAYLKNATDKCYKDQHMGEDFPNYPQIRICKDTEKERVFGPYDDTLASTRDSTRFRYQDCIVGANNDMQKSLFCVQNYIAAIRRDNEKITNWFVGSHQQWL